MSVGEVALLVAVIIFAIAAIWERSLVAAGLTALALGHLLM